jgi:Immunity protein 53
MPRNDLEWLDGWYQRQCNGEWEHRQGMRLEPLDDPGWHLTINLAGTSAVNARPQELRLETHGGGWLACSIAGGCFEGSGDPRKLEQIIGIFRRWVEFSPRNES